jgi:hypothetical protein
LQAFFTTAVCMVSSCSNQSSYKGVGKDEKVGKKVGFFLGEVQNKRQGGIPCLLNGLFT